MFKVFMGFITGVVVGAYYMVGEPNIIVKNIVLILKAVISNAIN
jgi:hypothetical protein